jgi:CHAT domain-containing protein
MTPPLARWARTVALCLSCAGWVIPWASEARAGRATEMRLHAEQLLSQGDVSQAIALLQQAQHDAPTPAAAARVNIALGMALTQAQRIDEAQAALDNAVLHAPSGAVRAAANLALGNLAWMRKDLARAEALYAAVINEPQASRADGIAAQINGARMMPAEHRAPRLSVLAQAIGQLGTASERIPLLLNAGTLALQSGAGGRTVAYAALEQARRETQVHRASRDHLVALDGLAQLYEAEGRWDEVVHLNNLAVEAAKSSTGQVRDVLMMVEWRQARAWRHTGRGDLALAAAMRAVEHAQAVRPDLPIETAEGQSTYQTLFRPLLELFVDLQLSAIEGWNPDRQELALRQVRDAVEAMRQAEMQDFLGDRCTVEEADAAVLEKGAVALYPVLLADRVELLVQTRDGLRRVSLPIPRDRVVRASGDLARALRNGQEGYLRPSRELYDWLIRPVAENLKAHHTLVVVPDGPLRLVPFGVLHDGERPLVQQMAVATVTGMSMTEAGRLRTGRPQVLLAGVAVPGSVVEKISLKDVLRPASGAGDAVSRAPALQPRSTRSVARALSQRDLEARREELALPGVREEVAAIAAFTQGKVLLDGGFTLESFEREVEGGDYRMVHIASHGVFGGSAQSSYVLAFDDLLGIGRLQGMLRSEQLQQHPIDLLTLSACETAEGNDRAPLGIAGAAMSARARSVLGTLWPVDDEAAREVMERFYRGLVNEGLSKAQALRAAQLALMRQPDTRHPYFWAPFSLIGNWR